MEHACFPSRCPERHPHHCSPSPQSYRPPYPRASESHSFTHSQKYKVACPSLPTRHGSPHSLCISPCPLQHPLEPPPGLITDSEAASRVRTHFNRRFLNPAQQDAERALIRLMGSYPFCPDTIIKDVIGHADTLFFESKLQSRVQWRWSDNCGPKTIGTTSLREAVPGEFLTQITLSRAALQRDDFDQRFVIAAILHEAIHSYLIILRGFWAAVDGGHTAGFGEIARLIDEWVGSDFLQLQRTEAVLEHFKTSRSKRAFSGAGAGTRRWGGGKRGRCR